MTEERRKFGLPSNHLPQGICEKCLADERLTRGNSETIVSFCSHNKTLGILSIKEGKPIAPWRMITPVEMSEVNSMLDQSADFFQAFVEKAEVNELENLPNEIFHKA